MVTFRTDRQLNAAADAVFAALITPERLARWWGPAGFTNTFSACEVKPGGRWSFTMHGPNGANYANESEFVDIVPNALLRIRHLSPPQFVLSIGLQARGAGTHVTWEQVFDDEQVARNVRAIVEPANEENLDRLANEVGVPVNR